MKEKKEMQVNVDGEVMDELKKNRESLLKSMHSSFFGCFTQQRHEAFAAINDLLNYYNFTNIIEIGTHDCGLSIPLALYCLNSKIPVEAENPSEPSTHKARTHHKQPKQFYTMDITVRDIHSIKLIIGMGAKFFKEDCFLKEAEIGNLIQQNGRSLLLCDGGDKPKEVNTFAKYLKKGDIIMGHDYFHSEEEEEKYLNKIWYGKELCYKDVEKTLEKENISVIYRETFDPVVWMCAIKNE